MRRAVLLSIIFVLLVLAPGHLQAQGVDGDLGTLAFNAAPVTRVALFTIDSLAANTTALLVPANPNRVVVLCQRFNGASTFRWGDATVSGTAGQVVPTLFDFTLRITYTGDIFIRSGAALLGTVKCTEFSR